ncbi:MAG: hypothetical protein EZS28_022691 [Streblomastix strix]|uniref:HAT C-terminal dimerisation domain-containing protein n=1 Tax=Streblomastix strix TaxID=222440 RepID=A0A5J4VH72_9EUKA|nr:MAG: hypothetical protein EZS28_022691 [Streblomastix strix]
MQKDLLKIRDNQLITKEVKENWHTYQIAAEELNKNKAKSKAIREVLLQQNEQQMEKDEVQQSEQEKSSNDTQKDNEMNSKESEKALITFQLDDNDINWLENTSCKYILATIQHISQRLDDQKFLSNFSIFDPQLALINKDNHEYGLEQLDQLLQLYYKQLNNIRKDNLHLEWRRIREMLVSQSVFVNCKQKDICQIIAKRKDKTFDRFPSFQFLSRACLSIPVDNCWPECGFSQIQRIKPLGRYKLGTRMLQWLMNIKMNGWSKMSKQKAREIAEQWYYAKDRRMGGHKEDTVESLQTNTYSEMFELSQLSIFDTNGFIYE